MKTMLMLIFILIFDLFNIKIILHYYNESISFQGFISDYKYNIQSILIKSLFNHLKPLCIGVVLFWIDLIFKTVEIDVLPTFGFIKLTLTTYFIMIGIIPYPILAFAAIPGLFRFIFISFISFIFFIYYLIQKIAFERGNYVGLKRNWVLTTGVLTLSLVVAFLLDTGLDSFFLENNL